MAGIVTKAQRTIGAVIHLQCHCRQLCWQAGAVLDCSVLMGRGSLRQTLFPNPHALLVSVSPITAWSYWSRTRTQSYWLAHDWMSWRSIV